MSHGSIEHPALVSAVRHGLDQEPHPTTLESVHATNVLRRASFDRVTGFLAAAVIDGLVNVEDAEVVDDLHRQWRDELRMCVRLEALLVQTAEILDDEVRWRLTKGAALAHLDYPDPSLRTFGDIDLVVHPDDWTAATSRLAAHSYRRASTALPGRYDSRWGKGATFVTESGIELDLHRRFAIGRFGVASTMEDLFRDGDDDIALAGRSIPVLDPANRLLHACYHATLGGFRRLRAFRDVAQLILVSGADWRKTFATARAWQAEAVVVAGITECWKRLDLDTSHPAHLHATGTAISRTDRKALQPFTDERRFRSQALTALSRLPRRDVPSYLWVLSRHRLRRGRRT